MDIKIIGMRLVREEYTNPAGNTLLATFDMHVGPIAIYACALVRTAEGAARVRPPLRKRDGDKSGYNIRDSEVREEVNRRAAAAWEALSGNLFPAP